MSLLSSLEYPRQINEPAARVTAGLVSSAILAGWLGDAPWVLALLAADFLVRLGLGPRFSPLARPASALAKRFFAVRMVASSPKRFAQGLGAACLLIACGLVLWGYTGAAWVVALMIALLAGVEAVFGFCLGCWLYRRLQAFGLVSPTVCIDCVRPRSSGGPSEPAPNLE